MENALPPTDPDFYLQGITPSGQTYFPVAPDYSDYFYFEPDEPLQQVPMTPLPVVDPALLASIETELQRAPGAASLPPPPPPRRGMGEWGGLLMAGGILAVFALVLNPTPRRR